MTADPCPRIERRPDRVGLAKVTRDSDTTYFMPIPCEFTISKHIIDRCQGLAIRIAPSILIREVVVHKRPHLSGTSIKSENRPQATYLFLHRLYHLLHRDRNHRLTAGLPRTLETLVSTAPPDLCCRRTIPIRPTISLTTRCPSTTARNFEYIVQNRSNSVSA